MPRFAKCIWTHKIHSMHMTLRLFISVCFQYLKIKLVPYFPMSGKERKEEKEHRQVGGSRTELNGHNKYNTTGIVGGKPHSMTPGKEKSDLYESHVQWELGLVIHPHQRISSVQH